MKTEKIKWKPFVMFFHILQHSFVCGIHTWGWQSFEWICLAFSVQLLLGIESGL